MEKTELRFFWGGILFFLFSISPCLQAGDESWEGDSEFIYQMGVSIRKNVEEIYVGNDLYIIEGEGVIVVNVEPDSPAERSGIKEGDIIAEVYGIGIKDPFDIAYLIKLSQGRVRLTIFREEKTLEKEVQLEKRHRNRRSDAEFMKRFQEAIEYEPPESDYTYWMGVEIRKNVEETYERNNSYPIERGGVIVVNVEPNSPAEKSGIKEGDIITEVDGLIVEDPNNLVSLLQFSQGRTLLTIFREEKNIRKEVQLEKRYKNRKFAPESLKRPPEHFAEEAPEEKPNDLGDTEKSHEDDQPLASEQDFEDAFEGF